MNYFEANLLFKNQSKSKFREHLSILILSLFLIAVITNIVYDKMFNTPINIINLNNYIPTKEEDLSAFEIFPEIFTNNTECNMKVSLYSRDWYIDNIQMKKEAVNIEENQIFKYTFERDINSLKSLRIDIKKPSINKLNKYFYQLEILFDNSCENTDSFINPSNINDIDIIGNKLIENKKAYYDFTERIPFLGANRLINIINLKFKQTIIKEHNNFYNFLSNPLSFTKLNDNNFSLLKGYILERQEQYNIINLTKEYKIALINYNFNNKTDVIVRVYPNIGQSICYIFLFFLFLVKIISLLFLFYDKYGKYKNLINSFFYVYYKDKVNNNKNTFLTKISPSNSFKIKSNINKLEDKNKPISINSSCLTTPLKEEKQHINDKELIKYNFSLCDILVMNLPFLSKSFKVKKLIFLNCIEQFTYYLNPLYYFKLCALNENKIITNISNDEFAFSIEIKENFSTYEILRKTISS